MYLTRRGVRVKDLLIISLPFDVLRTLVPMDRFLESRSGRARTGPVGF